MIILYEIYGLNTWINNHHTYLLKYIACICNEPDRIPTILFSSKRPNKKKYSCDRLILGKKYSEITFPMLCPDPTTKKDVYFLNILYM